MNARTQAELKLSLDRDNDLREASADQIEASLARQRMAWELHKLRENANNDAAARAIGAYVPQHG